MRLFSRRSSPVWSRPNTGLCRTPLALRTTLSSTAPKVSILVASADSFGHHDGVANTLTQACRLRPFAALNSSRVSSVPPLVWGLRFRLKGKTMRIRRVMRRRYLLRIGTSHPSTACVLFGVGFRHTAKQKQSAWGFSWSLLSSYVTYVSRHKYPNLYHGRGLRPSRLALFWKSGKVSAYR